MRPGARIPVDGVVVGGHSFVDQAAITGESMPVEKIAGTRVFAGTINLSGVLEIRTDKLGKDTAFGRIIEAGGACRAFPRADRTIADRLAGYLVYFALACAALTFLITRDARSTISVIVVAGACGIAAGTPLAILGGIGRAARAGAIVKGGLYLEILSTVDTVVLDKTGTLTLGTPEIFDVRVYNGSSPQEVVRIAATAGRFSEHPLAKAIVKKASEWSSPAGEPQAFQYFPGKGIVCEVAGQRTLVGTRALVEQERVPLPDDGSQSERFSEVMVATGGRVSWDRSGWPTFCVRRQRRSCPGNEGPGLTDGIADGDRKEIGGRNRAGAGVDEVNPSLLPEQKVARVREPAGARVSKVAMVGDGVNDAPASDGIELGTADGVGHGRGARKRFRGAAGQRFVAVCRGAENRPPLPQHHMANFTGTLRGG